MTRLTTHTGAVITVGNQFAEGGEGVLYDVHGQKGKVAKLFHPHRRDAERAAKLALMVANPPRDPTRPGHISLAWPEATLYENGAFVGFLMPRIDQSKDIVYAYNPSRRAQFFNFHWGYLHRMASNLCLALSALHQSGYVIGDINEKNVLVDGQAMVTFVDTDSFQVTDRATGRVYRSIVGTPGYVPPELQGVNLSSVDRTPVHDRYGLAVLLFKLLMEGNHPFTSTLPENESLEGLQIFDDNSRQGIFPYVSKQRRPPAGAPDFTTLHPDVQRLFKRAFVAAHYQPDQRPEPAEWAVVLQAAEKDLKPCKRKPQEHYHASHVRDCPWCAREAQGITSQPLLLPTQQPLPPAGRPATTAMAAATTTTTGRGSGSYLPPEAKGLCWGGFFLPWLWSFAHRLWLPGLAALAGLAFSLYYLANVNVYGPDVFPTSGAQFAAVLALPALYALVSLILLFRGRRMAWQARTWTDAPAFGAAQRRWSWLGLVASAFLLGGRYTASFMPETYLAPLAAAAPVGVLLDELGATAGAPPADAFLEGDEPAGAPDADASHGELLEGESAAPSAGPADAPQVRVQLNATNVRAGPGEQYAVIGSVVKDTLLPVLGTDAARNWYNVELDDGERGWIGSLVVEELDSLDSVPVAATIPAP